MAMQSGSAMTLSLVGLNDELSDRRYPLDRPVWIGKAVVADIFVPELTLRRCHCRIEQTDTGPVIVDFSGTGLFVNGTLVRRQRLEPGDVLRFGRFRFRVTADPQPQITSASPARGPDVSAPVNHSGAAPNPAAVRLAS